MNLLSNSCTLFCTTLFVYLHLRPHNTYGIFTVQHRAFPSPTSFFARELHTNTKNNTPHRATATTTTLHKHGDTRSKSKARYTQRRNYSRVNKKQTRSVKCSKPGSFENLMKCSSSSHQPYSMHSLEKEKKLLFYARQKLSSGPTYTNYKSRLSRRRELSQYTRLRDTHKQTPRYTETHRRKTMSRKKKSNPITFCRAGFRISLIRGNRYLSNDREINNNATCDLRQPFTYVSHLNRLILLFSKRGKSFVAKTW